MLAVVRGLHRAGGEEETGGRSSGSLPASRDAVGLS